jgi:hypothetical protein
MQRQLRRSDSTCGERGGDVVVSEHTTVAAVRVQRAGEADSGRPTPGARDSNLEGAGPRLRVERHVDEAGISLVGHRLDPHAPRPRRLQRIVDRDFETTERHLAARQHHEKDGGPTHAP